MAQTDDDQKVRLRDDVFLSLTYYIHEQGARISGNPGVTVTKTGVVNEVLMNFLAARGHYPPKCKDQPRLKEG
jgi:hypothetical protein